MFATQDKISASKSNAYTYCIFLSPSGPYYKNGFTKPIKLLITEKFHRTHHNGVGDAKTGGNYAASFSAQEYAHAHGGEQVLFIDTTNTYVEEAGSMNHFHILKNGAIIIPTFCDTVLRSITSESILELFENARQEKIKVEEFIQGIKTGEITEAGGFGTAASVCSVGEYVLDNGKTIQVGNGQIGPVTKKMFETVRAIQTGKEKGPKGWLKKVERYKNSI